MKAMQMVLSIPRYVATKAIGTFHRPAFWGPLAMLHYREVPEPALPGPQWVKIKTRYGGICGSDLHTVLLGDSPILSAFVSYPYTLGHENMGTIAEVGSDVQDLRPGDRVVAEPLLSCAVRGIAEPCEFCARGEFQQCQNFTAGQLAPGMGIGNCRDTGGSWGPYYVAHRSQVFRVPENVSDENALMVEPFTVSLHPVIRNLSTAHETVVVLGAGVIGLCTIAALRACECRARIIAVARYPFQADMARRLGADEVIGGRPSDVLAAVARATRGSLRQPVLGPKAMVGGADMVYECVGNEGSLDLGLRLTRTAGTVVLLGLVGVPKRVDWTAIWFKELAIKGSFWVSTETLAGRRVRGFQLALDWMAEGRVALDALVTHRFPLSEYRQALRTTLARGRHGVIKSAFIFD